MPSWHSDVCGFKCLSTKEDIWLEKNILKDSFIVFYNKKRTISGKIDAGVASL